MPLCLSPQETHHDKMEEMIHISNLLICFSFNMTYSPGHCSITQNKEAHRLAIVRASVAE